MQFLESWLRDFIDLNINSHDLAHRLTMAGLEVEEIKPISKTLSPDIVVANILDVFNHPNSTRLKICHVNDGNGNVLEVVCGAFNAIPGINTVLARVNARLPNGSLISKKKIHGIFSSGMLCSASDIGLLNACDENEGLLEISHKEFPGKPVQEVVNLHDDNIFSVNITPNRGDCLSIFGIAREVSILTDTKIFDPLIKPIETSINDRLNIKIEATNLCGRFTGCIIRNIDQNASTPIWMKKRLESSGFFSNSSVLENISNYVMLEFGCPVNILDFDKIHNDIIIRWANHGETFQIPNGKNLALNPNVGVLSIDKKIMGLAGIITEPSIMVSNVTKNIYIGSAFWWPDAIARSSRYCKLNTESSFRYERGVDYEKIPDYLKLITKMILNICGGKAGCIDDQCINLPNQEYINLRLSHYHRVMGMPITQNEVSEIFKKLNFHFNTDRDNFFVKPPSHRFDLKIEEDLIEEIARIYGFEHIPNLLPVSEINIQSIKKRKETYHNQHYFRYLMAMRGYHEMVNYSFVRKDWETDYVNNTNPINLMNPISNQMSVMRSTLIPGLVSNICYNANRKQTRVRVFELGRVFIKDHRISNSSLETRGISEIIKLSGAAWGLAQEEQWGFKNRLIDFYDIKSDVESLFGLQIKKLKFTSALHPALHPGQSAIIHLNGKFSGWIGQLNPKFVQKLNLQSAPFIFELNFDSISSQEFPKIKNLSHKPIIIRDISLLVDSTIQAQSIIDEILLMVEKNPTLSIIQNVCIINVWYPALENNEISKKKSLTFRFHLQDLNNNLEELFIANCLNFIKNKLTLIYSNNSQY
ncbi:MAG: phenylalanine--tRNA ligase subunit beta [Bordetella sp.]|nr:MAG: phenylalanine--tRNA ligase subunit beta [Bordetella sp.]